jgi:transposase
MWEEGASYEKISEALGCSLSFVSRLKDRHKLSDRQKPTREIFKDDPTPEQIAERAAECRARRPGPGKHREERVSMPKYAWTGKGFHSLG